MTEPAPILLIGPQPSSDDPIHRLSAALGSPVEVIDDPTDRVRRLIGAPGALARRPRLVIVDLDGDPGDPSWSRHQASLEVCASAWARAHTDLPVVLLGDRRGREELQALLRRDWVSHIVPRSPPERLDELLMIVRRREARAPEGMPAELIGQAAGGLSLVVRSSGQKDSALGEIGAFMERCGVQARVAQAACVVADEMIINAVYNAPTGTDGAPLYRSRDRREVVELTEADAPRLTCACDGTRLALSIRDRFGSLTPEVLRAAMVRGLEGGQDQIEQKQWGAGLGLYFILQSATKVIYTLKPGRATEVVALFALGGGFRAFAAQPKSFHIFTG